MKTYADADIENEREAATYPPLEEQVDRWMKEPMVIVDWGEEVKEEENG